jgi:hypothetical protein
MKSITNRLLWLVCCTVGSGAGFVGCASAPQVLTIPSVTDTAKPPPYGTKDYGAALAAIMSVMVRDLKLPPIDDGSVTLYPSQASYEAGVVAQSAENLERLRKQLGPRAKQMKGAESVLAATTMAVGSNGVGMYKRVLINEWRVAKFPWSEWVRLLAHELTHTADRELVDGHPAASDQWLREGFAEWVGYKVVDTFGAQGFSDSRKHALDLILTATSYQTFPGLGQLARNSDWITWSRTLGRAATYGQAFIAVDYLIEEKGLPAVIEYFRLFKKLNNRERNFATAFGESLTVFDGRFSKHLQVLLGK